MAVEIPLSAKIILLVPAVLLLILVLLTGAGHLRWSRLSNDLEHRLLSARTDTRSVSPESSDTLPAPVQRYLDAVLPDKARRISMVTLRHKGQFNMSESGENWLDFSSTQIVTIARHGFDWNAAIRMAPGISMHVHDAYIAGEGILQGSLLGLIPLVNMTGQPGIDEGELLRFLAESAWYPTVLLPGQGITWQAIDEQSARATLRDAGHTVSMVFIFGPDGLIEKVRAENRGRSVRGTTVPTPWQGRWSDYRNIGGVRVPARGEVAWILPEGEKPYWRGEILSAEFSY